MWTALVTVYVIWGSTYLGIAYAGETIPPLFAASTRFITAGALMAVVVTVRGGTLRMSRAALVSCVVVGCLLPGANAVLFFAERNVPTGLASLIIASVPLWVVVLRLAQARAAAVAGARRRGRRLRRRRRAGAAFGRREVVGRRAVRLLGGDVGDRLVPLVAPDDAGRSVRGDVVRDARGRARDVAVLALHGASLLAVGGVDRRLDLSGHLRLDHRLHRLRLAARERAARAGRRRTHT